MEVVQRSPRQPSVPRKACRVPADVLFKRSVAEGGVSPGPEEHRNSGTPQQPTVTRVQDSPFVSRLLLPVPVSRVLAMLRECGVGIGRKLRSVEFQSASCPAFPVDSPRRRLVPVFSDLKRKSAASKVSRGLGRLGFGSVERRVSCSASNVAFRGWELPVSREASLRDPGVGVRHVAPVAVPVVSPVPRQRSRKRVLN